MGHFRIATLAMRSTYCAGAMALLLSAKAIAQAPQDEGELQDLRAGLERLAQQVEQQADTIKSQEAQIEALRRQLDAQTRPVTPTLTTPAPATPAQATPSEAVPTARLDRPTAIEPAPFDLAQDLNRGASIEGPPRINLAGRYPDTAIVREGDFERSITIPGDKGSIRIGGFVRAQVNFDFDSLGVQDSAIPYLIPLNGSPEDGTTQLGFGIKDSQLNFDYRRKTDLGLLRTFIEFDFFGDGDEFDSGYGLRLRHAALGVGNLQFGQFWSLFTDLQATPEVADLLGPHGAPILRTPGIRWNDTIGENWNWAIGIENPASDISAPDDQFASESIPNLVGYIERTGDWGHVRLSALGLELKSAQDEVFTGGLSLTGRVNTRFPAARDNLFFGGQIGAGFSKQYAGFGGIGLEAVLDEHGNLDPTEVLAGYIGFQHWWSDTLRSSAYVSFFDFDQGRAADPSSFSYSFKTAGNLFWTLADNANVGAELIYITRETAARDEGDGVRFQLVSQFNF